MCRWRGFLHRGVGRFLSAGTAISFRSVFCGSVNLICEVRAWGRERAYARADTAVAGNEFNVLEGFALEIEGDLAAMAASLIGLGVLIQIGDLGALRQYILRLETGAVEWLDF